MHEYYRELNQHRFCMKHFFAEDHDCLSETLRRDQMYVYIVVYRTLGLETEKYL